HQQNPRLRHTPARTTRQGCGQPTMQDAQPSQRKKPATPPRLRPVTPAENFPLGSAHPAYRSGSAATSHIRGPHWPLRKYLSRWAIWARYPQASQSAENPAQEIQKPNSLESSCKASIKMSKKSPSYYCSHGVDHSMYCLLPRDIKGG